MKTNTWVGAEGTNLINKNEFVVPQDKTNNANFYGRTYNEEVPYNQTNFAALQDMLDKRNELLGTVKTFNQV